MRFITTTLGPILFFLGVQSACGIEVKSPDGKIVVTVETQDIGAEHGCPVYRVAYRGKPILENSRLGLDLEPQPLRSNITLSERKRFAVHDEVWKPVCGERETIRDHFEEAVVDLTENGAPGRRLGMRFRAYDEGVAFCYVLSGNETTKAFTIAAERTQFRFAADHTAWAVNSAQADYTNSAMPLSKIKPGVERPLTVRVADDIFVALTEARLVDYARMKLQLVSDSPNTLEAFLDAEKGKAGKVGGSLPFTSPWRVVMIADTPGQLLEHDYLIANLNEPCAMEDTSWIKPGKVIREVTLTTAGGKACVDFCVERGMQYIELDAGWYGPEGDPQSDATAVDPKKADRLDLQGVIRYGKAHGIGVILYVNRRALERQMDELFPLYEKWGVAGVKFGFVNVGSQKWTAWVHDGVRKAAAHHLMVDIHDEFRSTGYSRTYPNLMTVEGIGGDETFPTPVQNATLPFTRFLTGPADHTYCWYANKLKVTHAHQLAITTINFSPWQFLFWYDRPSMYHKDDAALEYWKQLPTCWDETRVLAGDIGKYASVARRRGDEWFVGTIRTDGVRSLDVPLAFLKPGTKYTATVYSDAEPNDPASRAVKIETVPVDSTTVLKAVMPPNGGHAVRIVPREPG